MCEELGLQVPNELATKERDIIVFNLDAQNHSNNKNEAVLSKDNNDTFSAQKISAQEPCDTSGTSIGSSENSTISNCLKIDSIVHIASDFYLQNYCGKYGRITGQLSSRTFEVEICLNENQFIRLGIDECFLELATVEEKKMSPSYPNRSNPKGSSDLETFNALTDISNELCNQKRTSVSDTPSLISAQGFDNFSPIIESTPHIEINYEHLNPLTQNCEFIPFVFSNSIDNSNGDNNNEENSIADFNKNHNFY